jgi:uncharacterized protein (TIGR02145 family)
MKKNLKKGLSLFFAMLFAQLNYSQTVTIGTQVWATKNLDVSTFRNGDPIPQAKTNAEWAAAGKNEQPAWCYYDNNSANGTKYGKLYNWYAVNDRRGLAPVGYHIPTDAEWRKLSDYIGGESIGGKKMKATRGWKNYNTRSSKTCPNCASWIAEYRRKVPCHICKDTRLVSGPIVTISGNGNNTSGFSALPAGFRGQGFYAIGEYSSWWSSTEGRKTWAWECTLYHDYVNVYHDLVEKDRGISVRCIRD